MKSFVFILFFISNVLASDHVDGPVTISDNVADVTDFYAFNRPGNKLALVMNSYPFLLSNGHFTNKLSYNFVLRKTEINNGRFVTDKDSEITVQCKFTGHHDQQEVTCKSSNGVSANAVVGKIGESIDKRFKVFSGHRADPFFFNLSWSNKLRFDGYIPKQKKIANTMNYANVLSIVIEFPIDLFFKSNPNQIIAAYAETVSIKTGKRIDRVGRPEASNFALVNSKRTKTTIDLRDSYNLIDVFDSSDKDMSIYVNRIKETIQTLDEVDGKMEWSFSPNKLDMLSEILSRDYLLVRVKENCSNINQHLTNQYLTNQYLTNQYLTNQYLTIEFDLINDRESGSCGGRSLEDDFIDRMFSIYTANKLEGIVDGVSAPYKKSLQVFPYVTTPDRSFKGRFKRAAGKFASWFIKIRNSKN